MGSFYKERLTVLVGKGDRTLFWEDLWIGNRPLRERFPRLFRIGCNKLTLVQDVYSSNGQGISWLLDFRRAPRMFEVDILNDLIAHLEEFPVDLRGEDELVWTGDPSTSFSVKSLIDSWNLSVNGLGIPYPIVWKNLAPLRV